MQDAMKGPVEAPRRLPCVTEESPLLADLVPSEANRRRDAVATDAAGEPVERLPLGFFLFQCSTFWETVKPVALTMLITCLSVIYVTTEDQRRAARRGTNSYVVFSNDDDETSTADDDENSSDSNDDAERLGEGVINALVIIAFLCVVTFAVVLLYKYNCLKCLWGYMMFSVLVLFGQMGGLYFWTAIERYDLVLDLPTFFFSLYNFSVVGVISIFYQKGTPRYMAQLYLVALSAIFAWNLSQFEDWTAWCLLVALALYDLCAVLSPCGPLRALVGLMEERGAPMPGLLYETSVAPPAELSPPVRPALADPDAAPLVATAAAAAAATATHAGASRTSGRAARSEQMTRPGTARTKGGAGGTFSRPPPPEALPTERIEAAPRRRKAAEEKAGVVDDATRDVEAPRSKPPRVEGVDGVDDVEDDEEDEEGVLSPVPRESIDGPDAAVRASQELRQPSRPASQSEAQERRRNLNLGSIFQDEAGDEEEEDDRSSSVKLGIGDFVFYSVLVAKASEAGFATLAACFLVVLAGLGGTLLLLAIYQKALPALPLSIALGVFFFAMTTIVIIPYIETIASIPVYS